jgi:dTDP-4-amino-4,6-dideoxygalactose transaminase
MAESLISPRTKVITWVNYGGLGINVTELSELALEKGINLVEDAAHNFGVPTLGNDNASGDLAVFSFHATKNLQCGEGGAILVRKNQHIEKIYCIREKGTNRRDFNLGKASKYRWVSKGGSYLLSEINSALLMAQINEFNNIQSNRKETSLYYVQELQDLEGSSWSLLPGTDRASHLFALLAPSLSMRDRMIKALAEEGILAVSHYEDLASSPAGEKYGKKHQYSIRHSKVFSEQIIRLPLYYDIGSNRERVITAVKKSLQKVNQL